MGSIEQRDPIQGIKIAIDRGGTFTDIWATAPAQPDLVFKLLSVDPSNYADAPTEGMLEPSDPRALLTHHRYQACALYL